LNIEFDILKKPLEIELSHEDRTKPIFLFILIELIIAFIVFQSENNVLLLFLIIPVIVFIVFFEKRKDRSELEIINQHLIGKLIVQEKPFKILNTLGDKTLGEDFKGVITIKYDGYFKEVVRSNSDNIVYFSSGTPNIYYGTQNQIIINDSGIQKRYYIYLEGIKEKKKFYDLAKILFLNKIDVKEFSRGERTYLGKKLSYREIQKLKNNK
jgi:hypothetical protein